ncbi:MAG TPA: formyltetrahydrofolate deformylase [Actinomycetes bacterium]
MKSFILSVSCPDQPGIVARITGLLYEAGCNILALEQHVEDGELFFMRIEADIVESRWPLGELRRRLGELAGNLKAEFALTDRDIRPRLGVLVSQQAACLYELLTKQRAGELATDIRIVIGNHDTLRPVAESFNVAFEHVPSGPGDDHEAVMLKLLAAAEVDLVVLARYMRILSGDFVAAYANRMINIHHGFLPAFKGSNAYRQAWERGVKVIGATAHFVTADLDEGPIIAQAVTPVTHQHSVAAMTVAGRDLEKRVLAEAVKAAVESRIILHGRRTVVFHP